MKSSKHPPQKNNQPLFHMLWQVIRAEAPLILQAGLTRIRPTSQTTEQPTTAAPSLSFEQVKGSALITGLVGFGLMLFGLTADYWGLGLENNIIGWAQISLIFTGHYLCYLAAVIPAVIKLLKDRQLSSLYVPTGITIVGLGLIAVALTADNIGLDNPGVNPFQLLLLTVGSLIFYLAPAAPYLYSSISSRLAAARRFRFLSIDSNFLIILLLPLPALFLQPDWIFGNGFAPGDALFYIRYFFDLPTMLQWSPDRYFGTRLAWTLPGYLAYQFTTPIIAHYIIHLSMYYLATLSLYTTLKIITSNRYAALLATVLMSHYPFFLAAISADYIDGIGITYILLTILLLTQAAISRQWRFFLFVAGITCAAMIHVNLFLVVFAVPLFLYHLVINYNSRKNPVILSGVIYILGIFGLTITLGIVHYVINGRFLFFLASFTISRNLIGITNPWGATTNEWILSSTWLILPMFAFLGSIIMLALNYSRTRSIQFSFLNVFYILNIFFVLIMMMFEVWGQAVLQKWYYASYFIPTMFLAIGSYLATVSPQKNRLVVYTTLPVTIAILLLPFWLPIQQYLTSLISLDQHYKAVITLLILALTPGLTFLIGRQNRKSKVVPLAIILVGLSMSIASINNYYHYQWKNIHLISIETFEYIKENSGLLPNYWYAEEEASGPVFASLVQMSIVWPGGIVSQKFPSREIIRKPQATYGKDPTPGMHIFILSEDPDSFNKANQSLAEISLKAKLLEQVHVERGEFSFFLTYVVVESLS